MTVLALLVSATAALAESGPQWTVTSVSSPTNIDPVAKPGEDSYHVTVTNTGGASSAGPLEITDQLPQGLTLDPAGASAENPLDQSFPHAGFSCASRTCTYTGVVVPDQTLTLTFPVDVSSAAEALSPLTNVVHVSGGGAPDAQVQTPTVISAQPAGFGFAPGGASTVLSTYQAGAHPDLTTSVAFNTIDVGGTLARFTKDTTDVLPPGFAGDLVDTPSCSDAHFIREECAIGTQVGIVSVTLGGAKSPVLRPVYNLTPSSGEVAKLGFIPVGRFPVEGGVSLLPGDYRVSTGFSDIIQTFGPVDSVTLTVWGVPADPSHDPLRYRPNTDGNVGGHFGNPSEAAPAPFFTNPTFCGFQPLQAEFRADSWEEPQRTVTEQMPFGPLVGCDRLTIEPSLTAEVTSDKASSATGLDVDTRIPQTYSNAAGLATSTLKKEVVTLPEGMTVNPSSGAGLQGCSEAQYAEEGVQYVAGHGCPPQSRLATVEIVTPSLSEHVKGSLFLAEPAGFGEAGKNPFDSLLALYLVARIPARGVLIESPGLVEPNLVTGQLTTRFDDLPPLPFSLATFSFNSGANAPLVTPPACGSYTVTAALTPYSNPAGAPFSPLIPPFSISSGVGGSPCPSGGVLPFAPGILAGTLNNNAGGYSPLDVKITRNDGEQEITGFSQQFPLGLTANLTGVPFCTEAQIALARTKTGAQEEASPSCPAASEIGHTIADAGVGPVLAQAPGKVYMAGPFEGAPFSAVAITSAHVGPFDLGTVVVHLPLQINPETAQVSIPSGQPNQIPHIIKGIVIHVRDIHVYVDRPSFALNPTNCDPQTFAATVIGGGANPANPAANTPVTVTNRFQAADCANLGFKPSFQAAVTGKTSKVNGVGLKVNIAYPPPSKGAQANIRTVKVELPRQLPSRLTTLQKACLAAVFKANPANCPSASIVGHARAITPILPVPLEGPAYFVSNGGEAFPNLIVVLQGYGITIDLVGDTFISKSGITSSTFKTVPDQPVTSFELTLPEGKFSALAANGNLCTSKLAMPTEFVAQNGMVIHRSTPIGVTGCAKKKALTRAQKLAKALKACHKDKAKRASCERAAHKKYGPVRRKKRK